MNIPVIAVYKNEDLPFPEKIKGKIATIRLEQEPFEARLQIDGCSYHLIFGRHRHGWFLCIPDWSIGVELSNPSDNFWNQESLMKAGISERTAVCITRGLSTLAEYIL